jgi:hypothetical protein
MLKIEIVEVKEWVDGLKTGCCGDEFLSAQLSHPKLGLKYLADLDINSSSFLLNF